MWFFRRRFRRSKSETANVNKDTEQLTQRTAEAEIAVNYPPSAEFAVHMSKYIGETVTVFVMGGGISGAGFTGILLRVNFYYIQLITGIGPVPSCMLYNSCMLPAINRAGIVNTLGSITSIPVEKIASFVHNSV